MKKFCISFILVLIIILTAYAAVGLKGGGKNAEYLRIHIRADSNSQQAQAVKYKVKDAVVEFLTPIIAECGDKQQAEAALKSVLPQIEKVADEVLYKNGFDYTAKAYINTENFPTRNYGDFTLEQGYYDALIVALGSGKGDNWWCVVYPPLCFTGEGKNYVYKSKLLQIIRDFNERIRSEK